MMQPKGATARGGAVERSETEGEYLMALLLRAIPLSSRLAPRHERWLEYGRLAALPLAILPIPPDSPLAASPTGRARLESPARGDSFWLDVLYKLILSPAVRRISHCESNISLRVSAISPCVSRISSRVSALPPTSSCYSRGSGCGTRAAARWAVSA